MTPSCGFLAVHVNNNRLRFHLMQIREEQREGTTELADLAKSLNLSIWVFR